MNENRDKAKQALMGAYRRAQGEQVAGSLITCGEALLYAIFELTDEVRELRRSYQRWAGKEDVE